MDNPQKWLVDRALGDEIISPERGEPYVFVSDAMEQYASQQTTALQARIEELEATIQNRDIIIEGYREYHDATLNKDARIAELEGSILKHQEAISDSWKETNTEKQHAQTLMGLLEERVKHLYYEYTEDTKEKIWQSYCREHNL